MLWEHDARVHPLHGCHGLRRHEGQGKRPQSRLLGEEVVPPGIQVGRLCMLLGCQGRLCCCRCRGAVVTSGGWRERR